MKNIKEILFDCDGTLVDSEIIAMGVAAEILIEHVERQHKYHGLSVESIIQEFSGWHFEDMISELENRFNIKIDHDEAIDSKTPQTLEALKQVKPVPAMGDTLQALAQHKEIALVTSSEFSRVDLCLKVTGLDVYFLQNRKFSAHDSLPAPTHKPAPDVYNLALSTLSCAPHEAIAIEDSLSGVSSAKAAGILVIGYVGGTHIKPEHKTATANRLVQQGAHIVIDNMADLPELIHAIDLGHDLTTQTSRFYRPQHRPPSPKI